MNGNRGGRISWDDAGKLEECDLKDRILTASVAIPIILAVAMWQPHWPFAVLAIAASVISQTELFRMLGTRGLPMPILSLAALIALQATMTAKSHVVWLAACGALLVLGILALLHWLRQDGRAGITANLGCFWIDAPLAILIIVHGTGTDWTIFSPNQVLLCLVPLWIGDTAALFTGKAFGRHPLAATISPNKTWEGGVGNLLGCILGAWLIGTWIGVETWRWVSVGLVTGVLGQAGDLFESALKRRSEVKDSGSMLPGHGGLLDRLDSTLLSAIPNAVILLL